MQNWLLKMKRKPGLSWGGRGARKEKHICSGGRFITDKNINFQAMKNLLASLWRPKEGMEIHDIVGYRFSFVFLPYYGFTESP